MITVEQVCDICQATLQHCTPIVYWCTGTYDHFRTTPYYEQRISTVHLWCEQEYAEGGYVGEGSVALPTRCSCGVRFEDGDEVVYIVLANQHADGYYAPEYRYYLSMQCMDCWLRPQQLSRRSNCRLGQLTGAVHNWAGTPSTLTTSPVIPGWSSPSPLEKVEFHQPAREPGAESAPAACRYARTTVLSR
jgi:hypothetical protein